MITLYDLAFEDDRRPSPYCWRAKFALAHKGLDCTDVPMGFTEKEKIAFAHSKTVPVIKDGEKPVKDSWAIAVYLDEMYPDNGCCSRARWAVPTRASSTAGPTSWCNGAIFPMVVGDLYDRVRPEDKEYIARVARRAVGHEGLHRLSRPRRGRRDWRRSVPRSNRRAGRCASRNSCPAAEAAYPDYILAGTFMWPRTISPLELLEATTRSTPGASACSTCSTVWPARRRRRRSRRDPGRSRAGHRRKALRSGRAPLRTDALVRGPQGRAEVLHQLAHPDRGAVLGLPARQRRQSSDPLRSRILQGARTPGHAGARAAGGDPGRGRRRDLPSCRGRNR